MANDLRLLCVFAHPDDESLGVGGTLARYASEGVGVSLLTATRGERGWFGPPGENPGLAALGRIREAELMEAAAVLGLSEVCFLDYIDGELDRASPDEITGKIASHLRRVRPQVVLTFGPEGAYGHPDHIAISQFTTAACVRAADPTFATPGAEPPHAPAKLYYIAYTRRDIALYEEVFGELMMEVDGVQRRSPGWEEWELTTRIESAPYWRTQLKAILCHRSQLPGFDALVAQPKERLQALWSYETFYRAYSLVNGGREIESDLFAGLRP